MFLFLEWVKLECRLVARRAKSGAQDDWRCISFFALRFLGERWGAYPMRHILMPYTSKGSL